MFINHDRFFRTRENKNKNIEFCKACDSLEVLTSLRLKQ